MQDRKIAVTIKTIEVALKDLQKDRALTLSEIKKTKRIMSLKFKGVFQEQRKGEVVSRYYSLKTFMSGMDMGIQKLKSILRTADYIKSEVKEG
jgi:hypothetical protein